MSSPYAAPPVVRPTTAVLPLTIALGAWALVAAVVNQAFGARFPSNAPVEQAYNLGVTVDLVAVLIVAVIRVALLSRRPRAVSTGRVTPFAVAAATLAVIVFVGWLLLGGAEYWGGGMDRYMSGAGPAFFLGIPWVLTLVFGEIAVRRADSRTNRALSIGSLAIGAIVGIMTVAAAVIYGLGLSD